MKPDVLSPLLSPDGLQLPLARIACAGDRGSVLLVHGGSAGSDTFLTPVQNGLASFLAAAGLDVWLLDWRASPRVTERFAPLLPPERFTLDAAAEHDFSSALKYMREVLGREGRGGPLQVVAHCLGAGAFSMAIAGYDVARRFGVSRVVLLTLGLFYRQSLSGFIKAEDHVLERIDHERPDCLMVHPQATQHPWPETLESSFRLYPRTLLLGCGNETCQRLSFMFGIPYDEANLAAGVHDDISSRFGAIHRTMFMHCGQNVRRGVAGRFGDPIAGPGVADYLDTRGFDGLAVTLITGARNQLWHRDSIDRMHEFLRRTRVGAHSTKHVIPGYAHQDLLWGREAARAVFPRILDALTATRGARPVPLRVLRPPQG